MKLSARITDLETTRHRQSGMSPQVRDALERRLAEAVEAGANDDAIEIRRVIESGTPMERFYTTVEQLYKRWYA